MNLLSSFHAFRPAERTARAASSSFRKGLLSRGASARHNITILYSLTIASQPSASWSTLLSSFPLLFLYDSVPIYYETESFSRETGVASVHPVPNAPSFCIHTVRCSGGIRGSLDIPRGRGSLGLGLPRSARP